LLTYFPVNQGEADILVIHVILLLSDDAVYPHPGAKGAGVETKQQRCAVCPLDSPSGFLEHLEDMVVFQLVEGFDLLPCRIRGLPERIEVVQHLQCAPLAVDYRPHDDTFQLPHVAGPVVFLKCVQGVF
jgi:hypothetical protein